MSIAYELLAYMRHRKKYWMAPILLVLLVFSTMVVLTKGTAIAPFVYTLF